ncbi:hypothetical protein CB0940_07735 [Cercospora beticola]|uniref:DUF7726 domain-containing protein n=1 Tax=Cercospora beticola TaxID=122368 RepID=A0A2G5H7L9_CERBT|nr:hypothetical protein CB0940_07735 [Cercospora beticola]PIA88525.1 hypothetical protein CB0940_07735 [Cercospora beticola]WPB03704.1 hypothetical protein RHO25_008348 [Cercospora beticola]CAK1357536.1 unnamed protein product [Cercospora beticola]
MFRSVLGDVTSQVANVQPPRTQEIVPATNTAQIEVARASFAKSNYQVDLNDISKPSTMMGTKRKALDTPLSNLDDFDVDNMAVDKSCNQVRGMIRRFLDSGEMKKGEFADAIRVAPNSLNRFLTQNGSMAGEANSTYGNAWRFFKRRELAGIKTTKKAKTSPSVSTAGAGGNNPSQTHADISTIRLPGEESRSVPIFDTCDEIRKKINAYLVNPGVTQASFCRELVAQLPAGTHIQSKQLTDFRSKRGPRHGNTSCVFYAAYVFFEKLRLAEGKPKSKHRLEMEDYWAPQGGFDIVHGHNTHYNYMNHERPYEDKLGRVLFG